MNSTRLHHLALLLVLGLLAAARGRWDEARRRQEEALAQAQRQQMAEEAAVSHRNLAELALLRGDVAGARIVKGHPLLDAVVLAAVRTWRFKPALSQGKPVAYPKTVKIPFRIRT